MSEPAFLSSAEAVRQQSLWERAPAWRNLTMVASILTLAAVALPALLPDENTASPQLAVAPVAPSTATLTPPAPAAVALLPAPAAPAPAPITPQTPAVVASLPAPSTPLPVPITPQAPSAVAPQPAPTAPAPAQALPQAAAEPAAPACALRQTAVAPRLIGLGTIIGFEDRATSLARIQVTESQSGGKIDPDYIDNQRVIVRRMNGANTVFIVPKNMVVHLGDRVTLQDAYRNMALPCNYIPLQIASDFGPPPSVESQTAQPQQ